MKKYHICTVEERIIEELTKGNPSVVNAYRNTYNHFYDDDCVNHTVHSTVIYEIYVKKRVLKDSVNALSQSVHIAERTLNRYRNNYLVFFFMYLEREKQTGEYAGTLAQYQRT